MPRRHPRHRRRVLLTACVLLLAGAPLRLRAEPDSEAAVGPVASILAAIDATPPTPPAVVERRLHALGPDALPELIGAWWDRPERGVAASGASSPAFAVLERVIDGQRWDDLVRAIGMRLFSVDGASSPVDALETLARFGRPSTLVFAAQVAAQVDPSWLRHPAVLAVWTRVLERSLPERATRADIEGLLEDIPPELCVPTCRVLVATQRRSVLALVVDHGLRRPEVASGLLPVIAAAPRAPLAGTDAARFAMRYVGHPRPDERASAALLLGRVRDADSIPVLLDLLEDAEASVRWAAEQALTAASGQHLGASVDAWTWWYDTETAWRDRSHVEARLGARDVATVARALREVADHPLMAGPYAERVVALLDHEDDGIRRLACATLLSLDRPEVASALVDLLEDPDVELATAVWQVLRRVTGVSLPADVRAWRDARRLWTS